MNGLAHSILSILLLIILCTSSVQAMEVKCDKLGKYCQLIIPNSEIIPIWEHSCMKHMAAGETDKAWRNKCIIEWQKSNKKALAINPNDESKVREELAAANAAMERAGGGWGCNPPIDINNPDPCKQKLKKVEELKPSQNVKIKTLEIGLSPQALSPITDTFISSSVNKISVKASLNSADVCSTKNILWTISFPALNVTQDIQAELLSADFNIPVAPNGDRWNSLTINLEAKLKCNSEEEYLIAISVKQDERDLLRQEYMDMKKARLPRRDELTSNCASNHFSFEQFNSSRNSAGLKYSSILCPILDRLEQTRLATGNVKMSISSGFRNPYKNGITAGSGRESMHIYGIAADIRLTDFNGDGVVNDKDRELMISAAKSKGACIEPYKRTPTWIHMDWRGICPSGW